MIVDSTTYRQTVVGGGGIGVFCALRHAVGDSGVLNIQAVAAPGRSVTGHIHTLYVKKKKKYVFFRERAGASSCMCVCLRCNPIYSGRQSLLSYSRIILFLQLWRTNKPGSHNRRLIETLTTGME